MTESGQGRHPFVRRRAAAGGGEGVLRRANQPYKVEILDDLAAKAERDGTPMPPTSVYEHGPFVDPVQGTARRVPGKIGPFKLLAVSSAYWRGDQSAVAPTRSTGTVWQTQEEPRPLPVASRGGEEAGPPQARGSSSTCSRSTTCAGRRLLAPEGLDAVPDAAWCHARPAGRRGYQEVYTPRWSKDAVGALGHWEHYRENMFLFEAEGQTSVSSR
jgi:threonyl-tRNA synthetase